MKILITGACGFVGNWIARSLPTHISGLKIVGIDNLLRAGSETNRPQGSDNIVEFVHGDLRLRSDVEGLPRCDWVIDAAANPSVLAGVDGRSSSRQLTEHNLNGTLNILEYCRTQSAGLILLSTSRVYSVRQLAALPMAVDKNRFRLDTSKPLPAGLSENGIAENFSVEAPISLYGATKLSSEIMALEYGQTFQFPVFVNRCGVIAGAGQFGTAEQGIFSYWLHAHAAGRTLRYIGFGGHGYQVRDAMHPSDLTALIASQLRATPSPNPIYNVGGGVTNSMSLAQLTAWCDERFGKNSPVPDDRVRPFDIPWVAMSNELVTRDFGWHPQKTLPSILDEIADHVRANPNWLQRSGAA
jgi:CDP-paratose 2-epimerase